MLQVTAKRLGASGAGTLPPLLVGNEDYRFMLADQVRQAGIVGAKFLLEPFGRNTAPALTLAAMTAQAQDVDQPHQDPVLVIMPADHVIQNEPAFRAAVATATQLAQAGKLVTFGIQPDAPETGYGYIKQGTSSGEGAYLVNEFVEKPDLAKAQTYLASGNYLWNAGIFVVKASVWLAKVAQCRPDIASTCEKAFANRATDADFIRPNKEDFAACPSDSIDYAVMERLANVRHNSGEVVVVPLAAQWSDVGAWNALWDIGEKDADANVLSGDVLTVNTHNTLVLAQSRLVACVGLDDAVVVETHDAVLVAHKDHIQQVKDVVNKLKAQGRPEAGVHRKVFRPWGWYDSVDDGPRFQVKRIVVNPGASLSLQMHHHRAEHWIVVQGTARVTCDDKVFLLAENQSTYIPLGSTHRLENPGQVPLEIIEVQSGSYLGEDDIVRFEDKYGR